MMNENKVEIKIQTKPQYYFELIKKWLLKLLKPLIIIAIMVSVLYLSFYIMIFFLVVIAVSYVIKTIKG